MTLVSVEEAGTGAVRYGYFLFRFSAKRYTEQCMQSPVSIPTAFETNGDALRNSQDMFAFPT